MHPTLKDRDLRQRDLVPPERLNLHAVTVIGVGAIGRQVALQLAAMGVPRLQLIDHDTVEPVNLATQAYLESDLGKSKVQATTDLCRKLNSGITVEANAERYRKHMLTGEVVFCCVDSIDTRRFIWNSLGELSRCFIDGRMSAEVLRVVTACDPPGRANYPTTLFAQQEAYAASCTSKSTIYCANIAAGLMVSQYARWLRDLPVEHDILLNLLTGEWCVGVLSRAG